MRVVVIAVAFALFGCQATPVFQDGPRDLACWAGEPMGTHGREPYYCESNRSACVAQPANTVSSALYLVAAAFVEKRRRAARLSPTERLVAIALVVECALLGFASAYYHAALTAFSERLDMSSTYGVIAAMSAFVVARFGKIQNGLALLGAVAVAHGVAVVLKYRIADDTFFPIVLVALIVSCGFLARAGRADTRRVALGAVLAAAAGGLRLLDVNKVLCAPTSLLQGHAAWHALTALAFALGFDGLSRARAT